MLEKPLEEKAGVDAVPDESQRNAPNEMGTANEGKLLLKFAVPAIIGLVCNAMQNIINRVFVGNAVGSLAIAGVVICFPLIVFMMALAMLIGIGATTLAAIRLGQKNKEAAEQLLGQAISLLILLPAIGVAIIWPLRPALLNFFGATEAIMPYAMEYLDIILFADIFFSLSMGINNFIRAEGKPQVAMGTQILAATVNVVINYFFVMKFNWGVTGAAMGILIGNLISLFWIFGYFMSSHSYLKIHAKNLVLKGALVRKILILGMAPFLMQMANSVQQMILNRTLSFYGGEIALAAVGIVNSLSTLLVLPLVGFNQAGQPIIGYNYGARKLERVKRTLFRGILFSTIFAVTSFIVIQTCSVSLAGLFAKNEPEVVALAAHALRVFFTCLPVVGYQIMCSGFFQATGHPIHSAVLSLSRQVLLFIPMLLILPRFWGVEGAWHAAPVADAGSVLLTFSVTTYYLRKLNQDIQKQKEKQQTAF